MATVGILLLSACTGKSATDAQFSLRLSPVGQQHEAELLAATERVIVSRAGGLGEKQKVENVSVKKTADGYAASFTLSDGTALPVLTAELTEPFSFQLMIEAAEGEQADVMTERFGGFKAIGISEKDIVWVTGGKSEAETTGFASIELTPAAKTILKNAFAINPGKQMAVFVRGELMSRKIIQVNDADEEEVFIGGIPSETIAKLFTDDLNVSTHVTFIPLAEAENASLSSVATSGSGTVSSR